ncbi:MAG: right-handed parallel beta-helix repeat-containing protein, partial [Planctomycetes bacterium]|nr:right-handed parallel beta-helix repeat-containing protein [Planctomycetota bacterium]
DNASPQIINTIISNNGIYEGAGAGIISRNDSNPTITNCLICNNTAGLQSVTSSGGGGAYFGNSTAVVTNTTISNNYSVGDGSGIIFIYSSPTLTNCIIWGSTAQSGAQIHLDSADSEPNFNYCVVEGGTAAFSGGGAGNYTGTYTNNLETDLLFVSPTGGTGIGYDGLSADWSLQATSDCLDGGTPDASGLNLPATDIVGNPRIADGRIDMGAYEHQNAPDTPQNLAATPGDQQITLNWDRNSES